MDTLIDALQSLDNELRKKYQLKLRCISHRCDIDDLIQAIYLKAWKHRHTCRSESEASIRAWLRVLAANVYRSTIKQHLGCDNRSVKRESDEPVENYIECDPSQALETMEDRRVVWCLVKQLPERQRMAVALRYHHGLRCDVIAKIMGVKKGSACDLYLKGVNRIREQLCRMIALYSVLNWQ